MELRFLIISWMCICINKNEIIFEEKALLYGRKTAVWEGFLVKVTDFEIITAIHDNREYENY